MADPRQPTQLIARVASKADEYISAASDQHDYNNVLQALNDEWADLHSSIVRLDQAWLLETYLLSLVDDQQDYELPDMCDMLNRMEV